VVLAEETPNVGGRLLSLPSEAIRLAGRSSTEWVDAVTSELRQFDDVTVLTRACAVGYYAQNFVTLWEKVCDHVALPDRDPRLPRQRLWRVRAQQVVLATGAVERPLVFHQNDRPGIMLASAVRTYLHRYGVRPGRSAVVFANNDSAWDTAFDFQDHGGLVSAVVDARADPDPDLMRRAAERGIAVYPGSVITGTSGRRHVHAVGIGKLGENGGTATSRQWIDADLVAVSGGWS
ncbi:MAG: sarcosine oxidase subunit alpha, partial [bacterium]|nr:sarcosine oxidase subunit alpha [bacterium]